MRITSAPKSAAAIIDSTEYLSKAGKDVNGFQYAAVSNRTRVHSMRSVQRAQFFILVDVLVLI